MDLTSTQINDFFLWEFLFAEYRCHRLCQMLLMELKKDDPTWDPATTIHHRLMVKRIAPWLEKLEKKMEADGWVLPPPLKRPFNARGTKVALDKILKECGMKETDPRMYIALKRTFDADLPALTLMAKEINH